MQNRSQLGLDRDIGRRVALLHEPLLQLSAAALQHAGGPAGEHEGELTAQRQETVLVKK